MASRSKAAIVVPALSPAHLMAKKLSHDNFALWQAQVLRVVHSAKLLDVLALPENK